MNNMLNWKTSIDETWVMAKEVELKTNPLDGIIHSHY
jgi:hypothetical protein